MGQKKNKKNRNKMVSCYFNKNNTMNYKYPPIYKYGFLLLTIYMLIKHQNLMPQDKLLTNSIIITIIVGIVDFVIINNHPFLFYDGESNETFENNISDDYDDELLDDYDLSIEKEIESLNSKSSSNSNNNNNANNANNYNNYNSSNPDSGTIQINYLKRVPQENQFDQRQYYSSDGVF